MSLNTSTQHSLQIKTSPLQVICSVFPGLVLLTDSDGIILDYKADDNLSLYLHPETSLQKSIQDFLPQDVKNQTVQTIEKTNRTGESTFLHFSLVLDNKEQWFETRFSPIENNQIVIVIQNITEQRQKDIQFERQQKWLAALRAIDIAITSGLNLKLTLSLLLTHVTTQLEVDAANILSLKENGTQLEFLTGFGFRGPIFEQKQMRLGVGYAGRAALERRIVHIANLSSRPSDFLRSSMFSQEGFVDYYAVPLIAKGNVEGILEIFHRSPIQPDSEWLNVLETLGKRVAIVIENAMLFNNLQDSHIEILQDHDAIIKSLSHALDLRDQATGGHTQRVTDMTLNLARRMGIFGEKLVHIRRGAILHDIGKMGIPDNILLKPGRLTPKEWEIMRQHPQYALQMLSTFSWLKPALDIPYSHHEKWNGSGYPQGLKGTQIPIAARIFAVADVYDALTSNRPYRLAWSHKKAQDYIFSEVDSQFDPKIVACFSKLISGIGHSQP